MKSYSDLQQSKKLSEILPSESADMCIGNYVGKSGKVDGTNVHYYTKGESFGAPEIIPSWSIIALLRLVPKHIKTDNILRIDIDEENFSIWYDKIGYGVNTELPYIAMECPVDACVAMILELHKLNLL